MKHIGKMKTFLVVEKFVNSCSYFFHTERPCLYRLFWMSAKCDVSRSRDLDLTVSLIKIKKKNIQVDSNATTFNHLAQRNKNKQFILNQQITDLFGGL